MTANNLYYLKTNQSGDSPGVLGAWARNPVRNLLLNLVMAVVVSWALPPTASAGGVQASSPLPPETIRVARPTGDKAKDHANIVAAFKHARPGDTIQFAPGRYVVGDLIPVSTPRLTLLGSPAGTVLRGCSPQASEKLARQEASLVKELIKSHSRSGPGKAWSRLVSHCGMFRLTGGHDTLRNLTFEYMRLGLVLGDDYQRGHLSSAGGYVIEGNTFRSTFNSIRAGLSSPAPTVIRSNTFVDTYHAVAAGGSNLRILGNTILAPVPGSVPGHQYVSEAIAIVAIASGGKDGSDSSNGRCARNVIAGNVIDGYPDGIELGAFPGAACRGNVIRGNTISVHRAVLLPSSVDFGLFPLPDKTHHSFVGVPIRVVAHGSNGHYGNVTGNRIEGNRVLGAEGYAIAIVHASNNQIADNTITGIVLRNPFPGNANGSPSPNANGAGIWVSRGGDGNQIIGNSFEDIASYSIVLEGDNNIVRTLRAKDTVHDLGSGNQIISSVTEDQ